MVVLAIVACGSSGSSDGSTDPASASSLATIPGGTTSSDAEVLSGQAAALDDGVVTLEEYQSAFAAFKDCAVAKGGRVADVDRNPNTGLILYESASELLPPGQWGGSVENECYQAEFAEVEIAFATTDDRVLADADAELQRVFYTEIRPCMESLGIDVPNDVVMKSAEEIAFYERFVEAVNAGQCPG